MVGEVGVLCGRILWEEGGGFVVDCRSGGDEVGGGRRRGGRLGGCGGLVG